MGNNTIRSKDLMGLSESGFDEVVRRHGEALRARPNGEINSIGEEIKCFERAFGMSTAEMRRRLNNGSLDESNEICRWLMRASLLDRLLLR